MNPNASAIHHHCIDVVGVGDSPHDPIPDTRTAPAIEAFVERRVRAVLARQIAPRDLLGGTRFLKSHSKSLISDRATVVLLTVVLQNVNHMRIRLYSYLWVRCLNDRYIFGTAPLILCLMVADKPAPGPLNPFEAGLGGMEFFQIGFVGTGIFPGFGDNGLGCPP